MESETFEKFRVFVYQHAGVRMRDGQGSLLRARISERMRSLGMQHEEDYLKFLERDLSGIEVKKFINSITTNVTSFFRTPEHFDILSQHLYNHVAQTSRRYRVWSSASSTGEEPWSIAMVIAKTTPDWTRRDIKVLATDIDTDVLTKARAGRYRTTALTGLPADYQARYLEPAGNDEDGAWVSVRAELRPLISFARLNLSRFPYPMSGPFDIIFCRNVLIYFDHEMRTAVLNAMIDLLDPAGLLILGPSESALGLDHRLVRATDSVYQIRGRH